MDLSRVLAATVKFPNIAWVQNKLEKSHNSEPCYQSGYTIIHHMLHVTVYIYISISYNVQYIYLNIHMLCIYIYIYMLWYLYIYLRWYIYIYIYIYTIVYIYIYTESYNRCVYIYIYTYTLGYLMLHHEQQCTMSVRDQMHNECSRPDKRKKDQGRWNTRMMGQWIVRQLAEEIWQGPKV